MKIEKLPDGFSLRSGGIELLRHTAARPMLSLARADFHYTSRNGQHPVKNKVVDWTPLPGFELGENSIRLFAGDLSLTLILDPQADGVILDLVLPDGFNYARLGLPAAPGEAVYGGGMQFSHLNLRGRRYPIWTCEAGVGRNKRHLATILADLIAGAGGDYWTTYNPQPTFPQVQTGRLF